MYNKIMFQSGPTGQPPNFRQFVIDMAAKGLPVFAAVTDSRSIVDDILKYGAAGSRINWRPTEGPTPDEMRTFAPEWQNGWGAGDEDRYKINNPVYNNYSSKEEAIEVYKRNASYHVQAALMRAEQVGIPVNHPFVTIKTWNEARNSDEQAEIKEPPPAGFSDWHDATGEQAYWIVKELVRRKEAGEPWFRWSAFGFAGGNPHDGAWETEGMLRFLRLAADHPDVVGVCLHEYSFTLDIWRGFSKREFIGRFERLFAVCDKHGIKRPWIEMAEWGWEEAEIPSKETALSHIYEVNEYYNDFPEIKLAAIWTARQWHGNENIHLAVQGLAPDLYKYSLGLDAPPIEPPPVEPPPTELPLAQHIWEHGQANVKINLDAALQKAMFADGYVLAGFESWLTNGGEQYATQPAINLETNEVDRVYAAKVPNWGDVWFETKETAYPPAKPAFAYTHWPTEYKTITQAFGANPDNYKPYGLPGHEGVDIKALHGSKIFAPRSGTISDVHTVDDGHAYGVFVRIRHDDTGYETTLAHNLSNKVKKGDFVQGGQIVALADSTGNGRGSHCHLTLKHDNAVPGGDTYIGYPHRIVDPTPFLEPLLDTPPPTPPKIDMAPYFSPPNGRNRGDIFILSNNWNGGNERVQLQADGGKVFVTKNQQWERRRITDSRIHLEVDTSPGDGEYYTVNSTTGWMPRRWSVGDRFRRVEDVYYNRKDNCKLLRAARFETDLVFTNRHAVWTSKGGIVLSDVIELAWEVTRGDGSKYIDERYFFALGLGLVGWKKFDGRESWISEIAAGQQDNDREPINCL